MSYNESKNPPGDYQATEPDEGYSGKKTLVSKPPKNKKVPRPPPQGNKGEFVERKIYDGVGKYHGNHFISYFDPSPPLFPLLPSGEQLIAANAFFFEKFETIFSTNNIAYVKLRPDYTFEGEKVAEFHLGGINAKLFDFDPLVSQILHVPAVDLDKLTGLIHSDCVSFQMADDQLSFYGSTLKKNWLERDEFALFKSLGTIAAKLGLLDEVEADSFVNNVLEVNQHHFLAGRRSWAVGYDADIALWYVETVAFERNSLCEFNVIDKYGPLRQKVRDMWINMVANFSSSPGPIFLPDIPKTLNLLETDAYEPDPRWIVAYKIAEEKSAATLRSIPWYATALARHPGLTKGL